MANSFEYWQQVILTGQYGQYVREQGITHILNSVHAGSQPEAVIEQQFFYSPAIPRAEYEILEKTPFPRQDLVIYFVELGVKPGNRQ